jgi:hypothetical protein
VARPASNDTVALRDSLVCALLVAMLLTSGRAQSVSAPAPPFTERLALLSVEEPPYNRTPLSDNANELWFLVPEWADQFARRTGPPVIRADGHRADSPFLLMDKHSRRWSSVGISSHAHSIYPVQRDPYNDALIWFGANDGPPGTIIDWAGFRRSGAVDDPLIFSGVPGGLGLIDTAERTVRYFGPFRDLVSGRVSHLLFDSAAVWVWGRAPGNQELNGIARFDRRTATFAPYPIESKGVNDGWAVVSFINSGSMVSLAVLEGGEWFNRYEFDKAARRWRTTRYGWVSTEDVPMFERPDDRSARIDLLRPGMHFARQGHDHFGHPIVVLDETAGWHRVVTCRNVVGWVRTGALADTLSFVRAVLQNPATARDAGHDGPRMFLASVHLYLTRAEAHEAIKLFSAAATPANVRPLATRDALGIDVADQLWRAFETRRRGLP